MNLGSPHYTTVVDNGDESARFDAAVFRYFADHQHDSVDGVAALHSIPEGVRQRKIVALWSLAAVSEFEALLRGL